MPPVSGKNAANRIIKGGLSIGGLYRLPNGTATDRPWAAQPPA